MHLAERVVLVSGAARRVGRAIALRLAEAGCRVAVHCRTSTDDAAETVERCRAAGGSAEVFRADLEDPTAAAGLVRAVQTRFGRLDVLVNNASVFKPMTVEQFTVADWERTLRINLTAPMVLAHAAREALRQARGRIINLCDVAAQRPWPDHLAYMVSKGGLETLTRVLARALAPEVNVVGIAPGVAAWPDHYDPATRERLTAKIPLGRAGTPEDIAAAVHFVLSEGDYLTGLILPVDGGRHLV
ncbi:MAG: SDR family oxidoreductase [Phycisphaerae bacterium]|nr:SDR family oxidoreductase [Phycisphaerae bacterium]